MVDPKQILGTLGVRWKYILDVERTCKQLQADSNQSSGSNQEPGAVKWKPYLRTTKFEPFAQNNITIGMFDTSTAIAIYLTIEL